MVTASPVKSPVKPINIITAQISIISSLIETITPKIIIKTKINK